MVKTNLIELINNNNNFDSDESLCLEDWYFKSDLKLRKNRFKQITKKNLMRLSRAPFKYTLKNSSNDLNEKTNLITTKRKAISIKQKKILTNYSKLKNHQINLKKNIRIKKTKK